MAFSYYTVKYFTLSSKLAEQYLQRIKYTQVSIYNLFASMPIKCYLTMKYHGRKVYKYICQGNFAKTFDTVVHFVMIFLIFQNA